VILAREFTTLKGIPFAFLLVFNFALNTHDRPVLELLRLCKNRPARSAAGQVWSAAAGARFEDRHIQTYKIPVKIACLAKTVGHAGWAGTDARIEHSPVELDSLKKSSVC